MLEFPRARRALASCTLSLLAVPSFAQSHIGFDENAEPCNFNLTTALRDDYSALGVLFDGPAVLDGGAILDECGNFGVSGHSSPNFLAFNTGATLSDGGKPQGPQTIKFAYPLSAVKILAGNSGAGTIKIEAFDAGGNAIGANAIVGASALQSLSVIAPGIRSIVISFSGNVCVLDDLTWQAEPPVIYCTAKTGLLCGIPAIGFSGAPSAGATSGFTILSKPARDNRSGLLLYSASGRNNTPFQGGILCVAVPVRRSVAVNSGGNLNQCDGVFALDMNSFASGNAGGNPAPYLVVVGTMVTTQWWGRDSIATGSFLSDALEYFVLP